MGTLLSSCRMDCGKHCTELDGWLQSSGENQDCRFSAEVYKLSADQRQWVKIHPEVLSVRVTNRINSAKGAEDAVVQRPDRISVLQAATLEHQQRPILSLSIPEGTQLKRYTEKFVYWRASSSDADQSAPQVFALNMPCPDDLDRFCSALHCLPPMPFLAPKLGRNEQIFEAHMAPLMAVHKDRVEENPIQLFTKCTVLLREQDCVLQVMDDAGNLVARTNATECLFCLAPNPAEKPLRAESRPNLASISCSSSSSSSQSAAIPSASSQQLSLSFPARALLLQFTSAPIQLELCRRALNASSTRLAGTGEALQVRAFLRARLSSLDAVLEHLNCTADHELKWPPNSARKNVPSALEKPPAPVLLCECDCSAAAIRRRQSMAGLLRFLLSAKIAALDELNEDNFEGILRSAACHFPQSWQRKRYITHRVHLQAILGCRFSLDKTIRLLGQLTLEKGKRRANDAGMGGQEQISEDNQAKFKELELSPQLPSLQDISSQAARVMLELVQSERAFVQDLHLLLSRFVLPSGLQSLQCVRELHRLHSLFLNALEATIGPLLMGTSSGALDYEETKPVLLRLFALFIAKCSSFKVYSEFTFAHMHFQRLCHNNPAFNELVSSFSSSLGGPSHVHSLLIKPVQRLLKYPLFLGQLRELCLEDSAERSGCTKALRQMRILANWLNEMQRIQEDYGTELAALAPPAEHFDPSSSSVFWPLADLNLLRLFAHVRWLNPPSPVGVPRGEQTIAAPVNCVLFVFQHALVLLERKRTAAGGAGNRQQKADGFLHKRMKPMMIPVDSILLRLNTKLDQQTGPGSSSQLPRFSIVLPNPRVGDFAIDSPRFEQILNFECCHPEVCRHLALALKCQPKEEEMKSENLRRMAMSIDSNGSSSSDRGYSSSGPDYQIQNDQYSKK